jgi:hypothetical protein
MLDCILGMSSDADDEWRIRFASSCPQKKQPKLACTSISAVFLSRLFSGLSDLVLTRYACSLCRSMLLSLVFLTLARR